MLFADRVEIRNPGHLPPALSLDNLTHDHSSYPFNPLIAESLYLAKYIERMGTGIQDMIEQCKNAGLKQPELKLDDAFVVTIWRKQGQAFKNIGGQKGGQILLTDAQIAVLNIIKNNNRVSRSEIAKTLNIGSSAVQKHIEKLKQKHIIERIGPDYGGYWQINQ